MKKARIFLTPRCFNVWVILLFALFWAGSVSANDDIRRQVYELANPFHSLANQPINHGKLNSFQDYHQENEIELQYVSSMFWGGGMFLGIEVVEPYAYCLTDNGMMIFDISDPQTPSFVSSCFLERGYPTDIVITENRAYVVASAGALYIIDVTVAEAPIIICQLPIPNRSYGVDVCGDIAAVSYTYIHDPTGILILDVSDPGDISIIDDIPTEYAPWKVAIQDDSLLYSIESVYLNIYNISTVPAVKIVEYPLGDLETLDVYLATDLFILDTLVALSAQEAVFPTIKSKTFVFNMANASDPQLIFEYEMYGLMSDVAISDSLLFVALRAYNNPLAITFGLKVFDYTKDDSVSFVGEFVTGGVSGKIDLIDTLVYMATYSLEAFGKSGSSSMPAEAEFGGGELLITNVSDVTDIKYVGGFSLAQQVTGIDVIGNSAYILNDEFPSPGVRLRLADISDIYAPDSLGMYDTYGPAQSVHEINDTIVGLAAAGGGFQFINVADRQLPTLIGTVTGGVSARDALVLGDYLYIANHTSGLWVWDITDLSQPKFVDSLTIPGKSMSLTRHNSYLYVALLGGFAIVDISNPDIPELIGTFDGNTTCNQVVASNGYLYSLYSAGIRIYDLFSPEEPNLVEMFFNSDSRQMTIEGDYIFVASGVNGVQVINISDPSNPYIAGKHYTTGFSVGIDSDAMNIYVADTYSWITLQHSIITDIDDDQLVIPKQFALSQNYPNPFNPSTIIEYSLIRQDQVTIDIFNINGQKVKTLLDALKPAGKHSIVWDGTDVEGTRVASGIYIYKAKVGDLVQARSMILLK